MTRTRMAICLTGISLVLAGCSGAEQASDDEGPSEAIVLEMPSWQANDGNFEHWLRPLVESFNAEHDNITVELQPVAYDGYVDQLTTRFAAGAPPEILHLPSANFAEFASNGWLAPIDDRLAGTDIVESWTDLQDEMVWDGDSMGVLLLGYGQVLFYNQALFDEAGVEVPETKEELLAAAEALTQGDVFGFGATTAQHQRNFSEPNSWLTSNGAQFENGEIFLATSPEVQVALEDYRTLLQYAPSGVTTQQRFELFSQGRVAMMFDGPFLIPEIMSADEEVREHLLVALPPLPQVSGSTSNALHIPAGLDPEVEDAVWSFIEYAASPEQQGEYVRELGVPAPREGAISPEMVEDQPRLEPIQQAADVAVMSAPQSPVLRENFSMYSDIVGEHMMRMMSSDDELETILADLQNALEAQFPDLQSD